MSFYERRILLRSKDVDMHRRLRTSVLFELLQEAAITHTEELGMGREKTLDRGFLWVVTMQRAEITRMPVYDERVTLRSWPGETMHVFFPRHYSLTDERGEPLIRANALWMLVDQNTRRMIFPDRCGIVMGTAMAGIDTIAATQEVLTHATHKNVGPRFVPRILGNIAASQIAIEYGMTGLSYTLSTACASGGDAIGMSAMLLLAGEADVMLAAGADSANAGTSSLKQGVDSYTGGVDTLNA